MTSIADALGHRGKLLVECRTPECFDQLGGTAGVKTLIDDLYRRIEQDAVLRSVFAHFNSANATPFFLKWFGGESDYSDELAGGLMRTHQPRYISPKAAAAWLTCMREALAARKIDPEPIMRPLSRIAKEMVHSPETSPESLCSRCEGVQDQGQARFESLLEDAAKGRTEVVERALANDPTIAQRRGIENRTLAWVATYHNRPRILELVLKAGGDCVSPACDPMHATLACDVVHVGTIVSVTPLAMARKWRRAFVELLISHGAIDDVFTSAWLGDVDALRTCLDRNPLLVEAADPADDFQHVTPLCHAVCSGSIDAVKLLLERGAKVRPYSGKLLTPAIVMNRVDVVKLLIDHGADVARPNLLGRLDDAQRPVADLLIAHGKQVPDWMLPRACRPDVSTNEIHRVTVLLDYGANLNDRGRYGMTALHYAVRGGKTPLIKLLLDRGADVNALDESGLTPIIQLSKTRSKADPIPVMELMADHGADLNARDENQGTLLMYFARQGKPDPVQWLLSQGVDREVCNKSGKSAFDLGRKHVSIARLLASP